MVILPDFKSPADINKRKTQTYASTKPKGHKLDVTKIIVLFSAKSHSISDLFIIFFIHFFNHALYQNRFYSYYTGVQTFSS